MNRGEFQKVESLFHQCFLITDNVELCRLYVSYVRRVNDVITGGEKARGTVIQAFEFAINKVGIDINSTALWNDYLEFLKSWTPAASWEQQQKVDLIRKVYKKFLIVPTENLENSWSQYTKWENEVNPATAAKFISEKSAEFMLARSWNTEWQNITERKLMRDIYPFSATGEKEKIIRNQVGYWLNWVELEKKNILELKEDLLEKRIAFTYRQATFALPFVPELWFKASKFLLLSNEEANINRCVDLLSEGLLLNPRSLLLSFQLAELHEKDAGFEKSKDIYNNLAKWLTIDYTKTTEQLESLRSRFEIPSNGDDNDENDPESFNNDDDMQIDTKKVYQLTSEDKKHLATLSKKQTELAKSVTLVYVKWMTASKRAEGIKEARSVFKLAKKFASIGSELFVENALLEHYADNKKVALKIFDLGMKAYATDGDFLFSYLEYLIMINDVDNIRILIQTSDTNLTKDIVSLTEAVQLGLLNEYLKELKEDEIEVKRGYLRKLFKRYISYASKYVSLDVAQSFVNKYEQTFPDDDPIELFSDRYTQGDDNLIEKLDLGIDSSTSLPPSKKRKVNAKSDIEDNNRDLDDRDGIFSAPQPPVLEPEQPSSFVGPTITTLLAALPNASYFGQPSESVFNSEKLVKLFSNLPNIPVD